MTARRTLAEQADALLKRAGYSMTGTHSAGNGNTRTDGNRYRVMQWLEEHKPGTAQWITRRGGWDRLSPKAKRAIKYQMRQARREAKRSAQQGGP